LPFHHFGCIKYFSSRPSLATPLLVRCQTGNIKRAHFYKPQTAGGDELSIKEQFAGSANQKTPNRGFYNV